MKKSALAGAAAVVAAWMATIAIVDPRGNFPIHDDWMYAVPTWNFVRTGLFHFSEFVVVSLRAQVLWGALWTRLFGESFEVLRASTLALSLATLLVVHRILARAGATPWVCLAGALALLFNPIFLWTSCTYMSDLPYVFASVVSFYFFLRGLREERLGLVIAGCVAVAISWFIRQNGVVNLFPPLALLLFLRPRPRRWLALALPIVICGAFFGVLLLFKREWLMGSARIFSVHYHMWLEETFRLPQQVAVFYHYVAFNAVNCALFFVPLALPLVALRSGSRRALVLLGIVAALIGYRTAYLASHDFFVPYSAQNFSDVLPGPIFIDFGVGPTTLTDTWNGHPYPFGMGPTARVLLTVAAAVLATLLVWALALAPARQNDVLLLAVGSVVFGTMMLFASGLYFDRYSFDSAWAVGIALPLVVPWEKRLARVLAIVALTGMAFFSTLGVREYFAWSRVRWAAYYDLRAKGIPAKQIDGGMEVTGYHELQDATLASTRIQPARPYVIAFNRLPGYQVVASYPFTGFLGMRRGEVVVLKR